MDKQSADRLREIKTFPSLVKYLRDELNWPIESTDFESLYFDYEPEELGIDSKTAAKIKEIKQLRPLTADQPWGIFFITFEPKHLPVVALRRILQALAIRKRASANKSQQATWQLHDLLFISAYGETDHRDLTFAHFQEDKENGNFPALKVLGWDDEDTVLHLDKAHNVLKEKLRWPEKTEDIDAWRDNWSEAFILEHKEIPRTSKALALRMAKLATAIRKRVNRVLAIETDKGPLRKLMAAFRETLIHDLKEDDFADMYAQTITYGLLAARVSRPAGLVADNLADMIPNTNPFLRDLLGTFLTIGGRKGKIDFDELGINDVVQALRDADMDAVQRDFGDKNPQEDPVIHFYELFLKEYDAKKRMQRGVFYTPRPVVSYIVRSVDEILRAEFGLEDGLADITTWGEMVKKHEGLKIPQGALPDDPFVQILDPACGTGTFLVEVIDLVHRTMIEKWEKEKRLPLDFDHLWKEYVTDHLLPRLYGYELMMAPYAIAHMKIGIKLFETGYRFGEEERARVYLTNSLEPPQDYSDRLELDNPALAHEAQAVNAIKRNQRFTIVIGNPPYSYMSANMTPATAALIERFRFVDGERIRERSALSLERSLQDDFVKYFGLALDLRSLTGPAFVLGMITNNSYMDSALHRGLRGELTRLFDILRLVNLFGDSIKDREENVFEIQQGVAILLATAHSLGDSSVPSVRISEIHGSRVEKCSLLATRSWSTSHSVEIQPSPPQRYFLRLSGGDEFLPWPSLTDMFGITSTCIKTLKDDLATDFDAQDLTKKLDYFRDPSTSEVAIRQRFGVSDVVQWKIDPARRAIRDLLLKDFVIQYQARPFDYRWMFYHNAIVGSPRAEVMRNLLKSSNRAMIANRKIRTGECNHFWVTSKTCVSEVISSADNSNCFPLYLVAEDGGLALGAERRVNFRPQFLGKFSAAIGRQDLSAEDIFDYAYAVFHSPGYRSRYAEILRIDFPRLPFTSSLELFRELARLGGELVALHLMESPKLDDFITTYTGPKNPEVERVGWSDDTVWLNAAATQKGQPAKPGTIGFNGVPVNVWNFHIGGYQVCEKWLKDRKGRTLSKDDLIHYQKIVVALSETIRIMVEIDKVIDAHGGWPGAFRQKEKSQNEPGEES